MSANQPLFHKPTSSLRADGSRNYVHPADVTGVFTRRRNWIFAALLLIYASLPWIPIGGHPAIFLDVAARRFYLFGQSYNAQDIWLLFFLMSGLGFALFVATALWGRIWCGYACPHSVFLDGVFRRIERWIEGPRQQRIRRNAGPWTGDKIARKTAKHILFIVTAAIIAHILLSYFVSLPHLFAMMRASPLEHVTSFLWSVVLTAVIYFHFTWFREQLCLIVCPYGRLQSVMTDLDTIVIGYDAQRGEPRGKARDPNAGDCVQCERCVAVCPTGIDIRNGLQLECIGCAACVDACDEIMVKLNRPTGLVRYDSLRSLLGGTKKLWRPRLILYLLLAGIGVVVAVVSFRHHTTFEANLLRSGSVPYVVEREGRVQNLFEIHLVNKHSDAHTYTITSLRPDEFEVDIAVAEVTLEGGRGIRIPISVSANTDVPTKAVTLQIHQTGGEDTGLEVSAPFLRPH